MDQSSQFYKVILLIVLSIILFLGFKEILPDRLFPESSSNAPNMLIDSVLLDLLNEKDIQNQDTQINDQQNIGTSTQLVALKPFTTSNFTKKLKKKKPQLLIPDTKGIVQAEMIPIDTLLDPNISAQGYGYLQRFYSKLKKLEEDKGGKVRVAYFGDSMIDGDLIVQDFRSLLQDNFGGSGVGFVSIGSLSATSRGSVIHKYSGGWLIQSFITTKNPSAPLGIDGQVFLAQDSDKEYWVDYTAGIARNSPALYNPKLFYGESDNEDGIVDVKTGKDESSKILLTPDNILNITSLNIERTKSLHLTFENIQDIPIYGLDFSSQSGIHVDNFSLRGNSGLPLANFNTSLMNAFDQALGYDLIVLHYGTNVLNYGSLDYRFYERGMSSVVRKLRNCFPNADILIISTADKASKIETTMQTDPAVITLVKSQHNFARKTGCAYISLYDLMGGEGSMVQWVEEDQLANKDYTHFNSKGSKKVGSLLYHELEKGYKRYKNQLSTEAPNNNEN